MRNRAKCKLCTAIIESFHPSDYVFCKCGEISVDGGQALRCFAKDWANFLRVDDDGNEIVPTIKEAEKEIKGDISSKPTRNDLLNMLDEMIKDVDRLPQHAQTSPASQLDLSASLLLISAILRASD